jgi:hypothetical protein
VRDRAPKPPLGKPAIAGCGPAPYRSSSSPRSSRRWKASHRGDRPHPAAHPNAAVDAGGHRRGSDHDPPSAPGGADTHLLLPERSLLAPTLATASAAALLVTTHSRFTIRMPAATAGTALSHDHGLRQPRDQRETVPASTLMIDFPGTLAARGPVARLSARRGSSRSVIVWQTEEYSARRRSPAGCRRSLADQRGLLTQHAELVPSGSASMVHDSVPVCPIFTLRAPSPRIRSTLASRPTASERRSRRRRFLAVFWSVTGMNRCPPARSHRVR